MDNDAIPDDSTTELPGLRRRIWRRCKWPLLLAIILLFLPYLFSRMTASQSAIRMDTVGSPGVLDKELTELSVVTYNIAHGRGTADGNWVEGGAEKTVRVAEIADFLKDLDAHIVVLNEVDFSATWSGGENQAQAIARQAGYPYFAEQSNLDFRVLWYRWHFGNAILSRFPIESASLVDLPPKANWESWLAGHKRGLHCEIALPGQEVVSVIGVHLESRGEPARIQSIPLLRLLIEQNKNPLILAGDLNTTPAEFPKFTTGPDGKTAFDQLVDGGALNWRPQSYSDAGQLTFSSMNPGNIIDWILVSSEHWEFVDYRVVPSQLSDHFPVKAVVKFRK